VQFEQPVEQPEPKVQQQRPKPNFNKSMAPRLPVVQPKPVPTQTLNRTAPSRLPPNANLFSKEEEEFPETIQTRPEISQ